MRMAIGEQNIVQCGLAAKLSNCMQTLAKARDVLENR